MQEFLEKYHGKSKGVSSYLHSFWSSAIVSVLLKWIKDGMKVPAEKIADLGATNARNIGIKNTTILQKVISMFQLIM
ncbi:transcriptional regulator [Streptococcus pneumoniae]|nr:transcriptional regulator [Streptococcus pneumoniae]